MSGSRTYLDYLTDLPETRRLVAAALDAEWQLLSDG